MENTFEQKIIEKFPHKPTSDQLAAIKNLAHFVEKESKEEIFILTGYAGTGKTTLVSALVNALSDEKINFFLMAPTGRAAKVFSNSSNFVAQTIHKIIYKLQETANGNIFFVLRENFFFNTIFIVDEASMISDKIDPKSIFGSGNVLKDLLTFVFENENNKLIFVGDTAQLPPVGFVNSPALDVSTFTTKGFKVKTSHLKEIVRQALDSGIVYNSFIIRQAIENQRFFEYPKLKLNGFDDIVRIDYGSLIETISASYDNAGVENTIVITYSNKLALRYNDGIRRTILKRENTIETNDRIMIVRNNYKWKDDDFVVDFIANGDMGVIKKIKSFETTNNFEFFDGTIDLDDYGVRIKAKVLMNTINSLEPALSIEENKRLYDTFSEPYKEKDKQKKRELLRNDPYLNALQIKFAYAITCHKAQGGQWQNVFVDQNYLRKEMITVEYLRWLYTAFTRAKSKLYLVNFNKEFFGD